MRRIAVLGTSLIWCLSFPVAAQSQVSDSNMEVRVVKTEAEWRRILTAEQYHILREKGTERATTGKYYHYSEDGVYRCAGCGNQLFSSETKYDSGSGWPSFWKPLSDDRIESKTDRSFFMVRTEILCARCGGHLGHVFEDGPQPTGLRYCVNSLSLNFVKATDEEETSVRRE